MSLRLLLESLFSFLYSLIGRWDEYPSQGASNSGDCYVQCREMDSEMFTFISWKVTYNLLDSPQVTVVLIFRPHESFHPIWFH
jgi:hypothetical protein